MRRLNYHYVKSGGGLHIFYFDYLVWFIESNQRNDPWEWMNICNISGEDTCEDNNDRIFFGSTSYIKLYSV